MPEWFLRTIPSQHPKTITDNRGHKIQLTKIAVAGKEDHFFTGEKRPKRSQGSRYESKAQPTPRRTANRNQKETTKKRNTKKINKIHEKVGAIKAKLSRVGYGYEITYSEDPKKGIVTDLNWKRSKEKPKGIYFLRYTKTAIDEDKIWDAYNLTRAVEAVFRCLKTDLT